MYALKYLCTRPKAKKKKNKRLSDRIERTENTGQKTHSAQQNKKHHYKINLRIYANVQSVMLCIIHLYSHIFIVNQALLIYQDKTNPALIINIHNIYLIHIPISESNLNRHRICHTSSTSNIYENERNIILLFAKFDVLFFVNNH